MSVAVWPAELPNPSRGGYQAQNEDSRLRRSASGPRGYRRKYSSAGRLVQLQLVDVPRSLKAVFDNFYEGTVADGVLPFYMPDPVTNRWPFLLPNGQPALAGDGAPLLMAAQWLCIFGEETPSETISGTRFDIAFSVVVLP